jgi:hypothetical protein
MTRNDGDTSQVNQTITRTVFANRVEFTMNFYRPLLMNTSGLSSYKYLWGFGNRGIKIAFSPSLPKTNVNTLSFSMTLVIKWRDV